MPSPFRPDREAIRRFVARQSREPFSYADVGATADAGRLAALPAGCVLDRDRVALGTGRAVYERAVAAVRRWEMFRLGWVELCWPDAPIAEGAGVAVLVRVLGLWSLHACRVVYVVDEAGPPARFGFAYGTLPAHALRGEERFCVEWRAEDDRVGYELLRFSQPGGAAGRLARPWARRIQRRFARDSLRAMRAAARG